jgi:hypothetical protein
MAVDSTSSSGSADAWAGERVITSYLGGQGEGANSLAAKLPWFIGGPIFVLAYLLKVVNIFSYTFYTLTNRRIRVEKGIMRKVVDYIPLEDVEDIRLDNLNTFSRTGDLEVLSRGGMKMRLEGVQDPAPVRQTILDAVASRTEIKRVLARQEQIKSAVVAAG